MAENKTTIWYSFRKMTTLNLMMVAGGIFLASKGLGEHGRDAIFFAVAMYALMFVLSVYFNRREARIAAMSAEENFSRMKRSRPFEKAILFLCGLFCFGLAAIVVFVGPDDHLLFKWGIGFAMFLAGIGIFKLGNREVTLEGGFAAPSSGASYLSTSNEVVSQGVFYPLMDNSDDSSMPSLLDEGVVMFDDEIDAHTSFTRFEPSVNIDGSPMFDGIDIHGHTFGVTDEAFDSGSIGIDDAIGSDIGMSSFDDSFSSDI